MYIPAKMKRQANLLSAHFNKEVKIVKRAEYMTLTIDGKVITQGEFEVKKRLEVLINEYGLTFD